MKKILLALGTITSVVAPITCVVACDMGSLTLTFNSKSSLTKENFIAKVNDYKDMDSISGFDQIISDLGLEDGAFASTDDDSTIEFKSITFKGNVLLVKAVTTKPVSAENSEETTMDFNQKIEITGFA